jgi:predicted Zn-dependent protease
LLVGWDSADWKIIHPMMDRGELPALRSLVEHGVSGNIATLEPQLSPMLWTSIATGKMAYHHGVAGFTEVDPDSGRVVPVSAATRRCKTLWEMLGERGLKSHVVGWFATQGERDLDGCMVSNLYAHLKNARHGQTPADWPPPPPGTYWPEDLAEELDDLRVSPCEIDPDEILRLFVPRAAEVDQSKDRRLALLAERLAEAYSVQSAATWLMEERPNWDFMAVYFRAIDELSHIFMPYHPPRMDGVSERDFEIYRGVVEMTYRVHDQMLQRLLDLAGPETAVMLVSDHGFHCDHLRPRFTPHVPAGITVWHRQQGVFAAKGPGIQPDALVHGARLLDIAPTVLHWFGLPVGEDMEGRVLEEAFSDRRPITTLPSWETEKPLIKDRGALSADQSRELLDQFVKLGYIDEISADPSLAAAETTRENSWNLARACLYGGRYEQALPLLENCHFEFPERSDHAQLLARCQLMLGLLEEADVTARTALATAGHRGGARIIQAYIALERKKKQRALELLEQVREEDPDAPMLLHYLSLAYLALRKWPQAESTARKILATDPTNVQGHLALARCFLHQGQPDAAVDAALDAVAHDYANPRGHFLLGSALVQLADWDNATTALLRATRLADRFDPAPAYRMLASVSRLRGDFADSENYHLQARFARTQKSSADADTLARLRGQIATRADARLAVRRRLRKKAASPVPATPASEPLDLLIVSGLPRSGTSLMMQILAAGGIPPMTDGERAADSDNPEGYYEWEAVKSLPRNPALIEQAAGKATKVISALLPHLPPRHRYTVIFMTRPIEQIARSQQTMLRHRGEAAGDASRIESTLREHAENILSRLRVLPNVKLLEVPFPDLVADPDSWLPQLADLLPRSFAPGTAASAVVRPDLFRNR